MNKILIGLFALLVIAFSCKNNHYTGPLTPEKALTSFQLNEDFTIEIFAAEPFVKDPVAMTFDDEGNAFVVEMPDYPYETEPGKGKGRIRMLIDADKDGRIDSSVIFADNLNEATSILPWKAGLIVTAAPSILYMKDTTGDFKADIKETLYTGFFTKNMEAQVTALQFNIDNWIYATNAGQEGTISTDSVSGKQKIDLKGGDFRFRLDREEFERESGSGQFGQTIDDWGHRFQARNSNHIEEAIIPWRYLHRHPNMPSASVVIDITDHAQLMNQVTPPPYWRAERSKRRNAAFQEQKSDRVEYADDHFTGASGGIVYGGDAFPEEYYGNYFITEVAGNLVHRDILLPSDSSPAYIASLAASDKNKEFLASTDPWFRPTNLTVGPDGCLYIVDMYRQHIETPFAIPEDLKKEMDFMNGSEMGRIYRIVPKNGKVDKSRSFNFQKMVSAELVKFLSHPSHSFRFQAQKLLIERQDKSIIPSLVTVFSEDKDPRARLHALYTLEGLNALNPNLIKQAINDLHPGVREAGIKLAEQYPECLPLLVERTKDSSIQVAFQATLSLGNYPFKQSGAALADVMMRHGQDRWFRTAVLSSEAGSSLAFFEMLADQGWFRNTIKKGQTDFLKDFSNILGLRNNKDEIIKFEKTVSEDGLIKEKEYKIAVLNGLAKGYKNSENTPKADTALKVVFEEMVKGTSDKEEKDAIESLVKAMQ